MLRTAIWDLFSIKHPIQGVMADVGTAELVPAVSIIGAPGIIGCSFFRHTAPDGKHVNLFSLNNCRIGDSCV